MSGPFIIETDWPRLADKADYEKFARRNLLDIEQLASLTAGYVPRTWRNTSPRNEDPTRKVTRKDGTIEWRRRPRPYAGAVNWGVLRRPDGAVGSLMTRWLREHPDVYDVAPREWVDFCKRERLPMPAELRRHYRPPVRRVSVSETKKETANREREELYRRCTLEALTALDRCRGICLTKRQLWKLVVARIRAQGGSKVPQFERFKQLLRKWRHHKEDRLSRRLVRLLHKRRGPLAEDKQHAVRTLVLEQAPEIAAVLFPNTTRQVS
jgi:hypothetical protein